MKLNWIKCHCHPQQIEELTIINRPGHENDDGEAK
jgi:hypothetical protein